MARPPSTKDGRTMTGYPSSPEALRADSSLVTMVPGGCLMSRRVSTSYQRSLSSARSMSSGCVPQICTFPLPAHTTTDSLSAMAMNLLPCICSLITCPRAAYPRSGHFPCLLTPPPKSHQPCQARWLYDCTELAALNSPHHSQYLA